jgi:hypothetical protein
MSHNTEESGHGHSIAAWTTTIVVIVAFSIGTFFFFLENAPAVYASAALALAGVVAGYVLKKMGYGVGGQHTKSH